MITFERNSRNSHIRIGDHAPINPRKTPRWIIVRPESGTRELVTWEPVGDGTAITTLI